MGQKARSDEIEKILLDLTGQTHDRIQSKPGRLIDALQARAIFDARKIATELTKDLALFGPSEAQSKLSLLVANGKDRVQKQRRSRRTK